MTFCSTPLRQRSQGEKCQEFLIERHYVTEKARPIKRRGTGATHSQAQPQNSQWVSHLLKMFQRRWQLTKCSYGSGPCRASPCELNILEELHRANSFARCSAFNANFPKYRISKYSAFKRAGWIPNWNKRGGKEKKKEGPWCPCGLTVLLSPWHMGGSHFLPASA